MKVHRNCTSWVERMQRNYMVVMFFPFSVFGEKQWVSFREKLLFTTAKITVAALAAFSEMSLGCLGLCPCLLLENSRILCGECNNKHIFF